MLDVLVAAVVSTHPITDRITGFEPMIDDCIVTTELRHDKGFSFLNYFKPKSKVNEVMMISPDGSLVIETLIPSTESGKSKAGKIIRNKTYVIDIEPI